MFSTLGGFYRKTLNVHKDSIGRYRTCFITNAARYSGAVIILVALVAANIWADEESKYLDAIRTFADNVLKYGRDTYGPKHTPLFVDGLNIHTHEPVKWRYGGQVWILSDLACQQNLFRMLDGLTKITGDPRYRQAAVEAIKYAFANLRSPNGLLHWGGHVAYDAQADKICTGQYVHELKHNHPYYDLMWQVNSDATKQFIEAFWSVHILEWSNLDMNRHGRMETPVGKPWDYEYEGGPVFFETKGRSAYSSPAAATDLYCAAAILYRLSGDKKPLIWSKRLAHRFVETRNPNTSISGSMFSRRKTDPAQSQFGDDFKRHLVLEGTLWPPHPQVPKALAFLYPRELLLESVVRPRICQFLLGEMLGLDGAEFAEWAVEEMTAWAKTAYRPKDNSFIPMLIDGTTLIGYVYTKDGYYGLKGTIVEPIPAGPLVFWPYAMAYRVTGYRLMWDMTRNIAQGNGFGDIGATPVDKPQLEATTDCSDPYALLGFLELYGKTGRKPFLKMASRIGDNIIANRFQKGFFVPSKEHLYTKFDYVEPLVLLHLDTAVNAKPSSAPRVWPNRSFFACSYDGHHRGEDTIVIYSRTKATELTRLLHEATWDGKIDEVKSLISKGADVSVDCPMALHYATERGHKEIVELLIAKGADINAKRKGYPSGDTLLHSAARAGHKDIIGLLITNGADVNVKNDDNQAPIDIALAANRKDVIDLFVERGAVPSSIHAAARLGVLAGVKALLEQGVDVNAQDDKGITPLHYAVQGDHRELVELLIVNGADINSKDKEGYTSLYYAVWNEDKDMVEFLVTKGADIHLVPEKDYPLLNYAVWSGDRDIVEILVADGARFDVKDQDGWTAFRYAASQGNRELVEFFVVSGADVSSFHMVACMGDLARVESFVEEGADVDIKDELGWTPLHWAASTGQEEVAEFLIANGANVNVGAYNNRTPLHQAAQAGWRKLAELFISEGAEVDVKDRRGDTPLHRAASAGHRAVVELLIAKGANVNEKGRNGQTPLYRAVQRGHKDVAEVLIYKGADINAKVTKLNQTFLHIAIVGGRKDMAALLITKGADVNSRNTNGHTPLHLSASQGLKDMVELLITKGADVDVKNKWGRTALNIAVDQGYTEIVELLRKQGAKE
jgi:pectate lyase